MSKWNEDLYATDVVALDVARAIANRYVAGRNRAPWQKEKERGKILLMKVELLQSVD